MARDLALKVAQVVQRLEPLSSAEGKAPETLPITQWVAEDVKLKYDLLQSKTRKRFGRELKKAIERIIREVEL